MTGHNGNGDRPDNSAFQAARAAMVARQIRGRGIISPRVLTAMESVPRHLFVPVECRDRAYADEPLPIGEGQTISQPYMVAAISEALALDGRERVLEIGAGCGYQAAVLSLLAREVVAVESLPELASTASNRLARFGYANIRVIEADGSLGFLDAAPYDGIVVSAAAPFVPAPLVEQLVEGGRLIIPVGDAEYQTLFRIIKKEGCTIKESLFACRFVPLVGRFGWKGSPQPLNSP